MSPPKSVVLNLYQPLSESQNGADNQTFFRSYEDESKITLEHTRPIDHNTNFKNSEAEDRFGRTQHSMACESSSEDSSFDVERKFEFLSRLRELSQKELERKNKNVSDMRNDDSDIQRLCATVENPPSPTVVKEAGQNMHLSNTISDYFSQILSQCVEPSGTCWDTTDRVIEQTHSTSIACIASKDDFTEHRSMADFTNDSTISHLRDLSFDDHSLDIAFEKVVMYAKQNGKTLEEVFEQFENDEASYASFLTKLTYEKSEGEKNTMIFF